ncbi:MAG TPA: ABC transporter permease [bacterium]|nr:ABC transporter permease [bacterium]
MKTILIVFLKEWKDTLRDRRTLIAMIVVPLLLFPLLFGISSRMFKAQVETARSKTLRIGLISYGQASGLREMLLGREDVYLIEELTVDEGKRLVREDSLNGLFVLVPDFDQRIETLRQGALAFYYKSKERHGIEILRMNEILDAYRERLRRKRFDALRLDISLIETLAVEETNLSTQKEQIANMIGGFLPYIFIIFCFMGGMYPAIDLAAGEKERGTLETLLSTPARRFHILMGKFGVVTLVGLGSATISILGLYLGIRTDPDLPQEFLKSILGMFEVRSIIMVFLLLVPLSVLSAGIQLSISMLAKTFKEAQSQLTPLMMVVIVPAFLGLMPGMELSFWTALIPILNVSLATKAIIAGVSNPGLYAVVYFSSGVIAVLSLAFCARFFVREETLFRT